MIQHLTTGILLVALIGMPTASQSQDSSEQAFTDVEMKMRETMPTDYMGATDPEFARSMIAHYQGAIEMAEVELRYGKDPQARAFAEEIIEAQNTGINRLKAWLEQQKQ